VLHSTLDLQTKYCPDINTCLAKRTLSKHLKQLKLPWISLVMSFFGHLLQFKLMCFIAFTVILVVLLILVLVVTVVVVIL